MSVNRSDRDSLFNRTREGSADQALRVRAMDRDDLEAVVLVETRSYAFPWSRGNFADCLSAGHLCLVGLLDGVIVAHAIATVAVGEAHLLNLCVLRDQQGHGFGRTLLHLTLEKMQARGAQKVFLEVRPSNFAAAGLYESVGFREIGVRKNYYPSTIGHEDARVLALALD